MNLQQSAKFLLLTIVAIVALELWGSWLWWMGYHRGRQHLLEQIHMFAPTTQQKL